ncbi:UDP-3-O-(3-hydroxymyristoyl)glucosamine N-acyltransferase [soil metagenome]
MAATVQELAALVRGRLRGDGSAPIRSARPVQEAGPGDITFVDDDRYGKVLRGSPASAALVGPHFEVGDWTPEQPFALIEVEDPREAFLQVLSHLKGEPKPRWVGIDPRAYLSASAQIGAKVAIHPFAYVGDGAVLGDGCTLYPGAVVGQDCRLGEGVVLHPNVVLYQGVTLGDRVEIHSGSVIGGDGFGYRLVEGKHVKIPQTGGVEIGDDVEIGSNCTIDRGTFEPTRIGAGSKIDNLVMVGHNNQIGRHNILCGQVGIAGSCTTGDYVVMGGQVGIKDHTAIGDKVMIGAQAGVHRNIPGGQQVLGSPAIPIREQRHIFATIARLPEMQKKLRELASQVALLTAALPTAPVEENDAAGY